MGLLTPLFTFWKAFGKYILLALAVLAFLAVLYYGYNLIYSQGHRAGAAEATEKYMTRILELQNQIVTDKMAEATVINDKIDFLLQASQESVAAIELFSVQNKKAQEEVLKTVRGQNDKFFDPTNCGRMTPQFKESWDRIRKTTPEGAKK